MPEPSPSAGDELDLFAARALCEYFSSAPRIVVVSPHFDDGVFSCGELLARHLGSALLTVFAGVPTQRALRTEWDERCGFRNAWEALETRRGEDNHAAAELGASTRRQHFIDSQYGAAPTRAEVTAAIAGDVAAMGDDVLAIVPIGLFHEDHKLVADACLTMLQSRLWRCCVAYEEALYRIKPGLLQRRLARLRDEGVRATPLPVATAEESRAIKQRAVRCYASQLGAFGEGGYRDIHQQERYWLLEMEVEETT